MYRYMLRCLYIHYIAGEERQVLRSEAAFPDPVWSESRLWDKRSEDLQRKTSIVPLSAVSARRGTSLCYAPQDSSCRWFVCSALFYENLWEVTVCVCLCVWMRTCIGVYLYRWSCVLTSRCFRRGGEDSICWINHKKGCLADQRHGWLFWQKRLVWHWKANISTALRQPLFWSFHRGFRR